MPEIRLSGEPRNWAEHFAMEEGADVSARHFANHVDNSGNRLDAKKLFETYAKELRNDESPANPDTHERDQGEDKRPGGGPKRRRSLIA